MTLTLVWVALTGNVISTIVWGTLTLASLVFWAWHGLFESTKKDADLENQRQK